MKRLLVVPVIIALFMVVSCGMFTQNLNVSSWTKYQKASFFMSTWMAEKRSYDELNAMKDKPENLIDVLKSKREILEKSRVPIRAYAKLVNADGTPDAVMEQEVFDLIKQLQREYVYK